MKTYQPTKKEIKRDWHEIDASKETLGRIASRAAMLLMGKQKSSYSANLDSGDYVVILNADGVHLSGNKEERKVYRSHSGYPGGFKEVSYKKLIVERPGRIIEMAVSGMLPKNKLRKNRMRRLKVVRGQEHNYGGKEEK